MSHEPKRVAYLVSEYPKISHTFIQREIHSVEKAGKDVIRFSIRTPNSDDLSGSVEKQEHQKTTYILSKCKNPLSLAKGHLSLLFTSPGRYLRALGTAVRHRPPGLKGFIYSLIYFTEAGILASEMRRSNADHLHTHFANSGCTVAMIASQMSGTPFSFTMHGPTDFFAVDHFSIPEKIARASFVACISHFCRSQMMLFSDQADWEKLKIVRCGIEPEKYVNSEKKSGNTILFVGRMAGVKGVPLLLNAVKELSKTNDAIVLQLVGDGPERKALEAKSTEMGIEKIVSFLGYQTQDEVADLMKKADIFALPSFSEGLPVVLMEALASSTPVITTKIAGVAELVEDQVNGLLIDAGDQDGLNYALQTLLNDKAGRQKMGAKGRGVVGAKFNAATEGKRIAGYFSQVGN